MSNKDLLKLENEFRNDLPKYKSKPEIKPVEKPNLIKKRVSDFLTRARDETKPDERHPRGDKNDDDEQMDIDRGKDKQVEMDIYLTPIQQ